MSRVSVRRWAILIRWLLIGYPVSPHEVVQESAHGMQPDELSRPQPGRGSEAPRCLARRNVRTVNAAVQIVCWLQHCLAPTSA